MAVMGQIPQYSFGTPEELNPFYAFMKGYAPAKQQAQQNKQQQQQLDLQQQLGLANLQQQQMMSPLQQQLMQAQINQEKAKTAMMPMQAGNAQNKQMMDQATKVLEIGRQNPDAMRDPLFAKSYITAQRMLAGNMLENNEMQQNSMNPQNITPEIINGAQDYARSREINNTVPSPTVQQRTRAISSDRMLESIKSDLNEVLPYMGGAKTIDNLIKNYSQATGTDIGESRRKMNALFNKKILAFSEELSAGLGTPSAEKAHERIAAFANPKSDSYNNVQQLIENLNALQQMHKANLQSLFETPAAQEETARNILSGKSSQNVPRGTQNTQTGSKNNQGLLKGSDGVHYTREELMAIAQGGL